MGTGVTLGVGVGVGVAVGTGVGVGVAAVTVMLRIVRDKGRIVRCVDRYVETSDRVVLMGRIYRTAAGGNIYLCVRRVVAPIDNDNDGIKSSDVGCGRGE